MASNEQKIPAFVFVIAAIVGFVISQLILAATGLGGYIVGPVIVTITVMVTCIIGIAIYKAVVK